MKTNKSKIRQIAYGIVFGYKPCCIESFITLEPGHNTVFHHNGFIPCENCSISIEKDINRIEELIGDRKTIKTFDDRTDMNIKIDTTVNLVCKVTKDSPIWDENGEAEFNFLYEGLKEILDKELPNSKLNKYFRYEIYTKNPETGETGWDIEFIFVKAKSRHQAKQELKNYPNYDCIITFEGYEYRESNKQFIK